MNKKNEKSRFLVRDLKDDLDWLHKKGVEEDESVWSVVFERPPDSPFDSLENTKGPGGSSGTCSTSGSASK